MGRHSLPDDSASYGAGASPALEPPRQERPPSRQERRGTRRRAVLIATALVLAVGTGAAVAVRTDVLPLGDDCEERSVRLRVAAAPDIAPVLRAVADRARKRHLTSDGHCLDVRVSARSGAEMATELARGGREDRGSGGRGSGGRGSGGGGRAYEVWLPDSALWVDRAASSDGAPPLETVGNVASSPVTLATMPSAAERLGWPEKSYSWAGIAGAATGEKELRVGSADPARSATGLLALTAIQRSTAKERGKDAETRTAAAAELLAERAAPGDTQVMATLPKNDSGTEKGKPQRNQALLVSEQAAFAHNTSANSAPDLKLFYPKDGGTLLDYPYTLVDEESLGTKKSRAASRFQTLLGDAQGRRALTRAGFRLQDGGAEPAVTHRAGGREPQPYGAAPADPPSAGTVRAALGMWTITVQSARLTLVVDASASMSSAVPGRAGQSRMDVTKASLLQGLSQFTPDDEIGLWEFATRLEGERDYRELVPTARLGDRGGDGTTQRDRLTSAFGRLHPIPGGATGLYDTALAAYEKARETYRPGKFNALVVLTDGANQDPDSISRKKLTEKLKRLSGGDRPVPLIAIAVGPDADEEACEDLAGATGGSAHQVDDPAQIYSVILKAVMAAGSKH
ncbi:substrate-binding domain-containing protein [Streptomyces daliensis]|uniref:VWA domain-containing protein n=1 Tax=Streptomyces daliensis TaxID=299421 RepID=A0A8T4IZZ1_9ACTN|nr:VWA domain-containing protein [Streptomyces daliensis]